MTAKWYLRLQFYKKNIHKKAFCDKSVQNNFLLCYNLHKVFCMRSFFNKIEKFIAKVKRDGLISAVKKAFIKIKND